MEYKLISAGSLEKLEYFVNQYMMLEGWRPQGGIFKDTLGGGVVFYYQPMIRENRR